MLRVDLGDVLRAFPRGVPDVSDLFRVPLRGETLITFCTCSSGTFSHGLLISVIRSDDFSSFFVESLTDFSRVALGAKFLYRVCLAT